MASMAQNPYEAPPRRRWFRFSLRTLFVLMLLASISLAWVTYSLNWIRQRAEIIEGSYFLVSDSPAPGFFWVFGEDGKSHLLLFRFELSGDGPT